jgi:hypothetical protein
MLRHSTPVAAASAAGDLNHGLLPAFGPRANMLAVALLALAVFYNAVLAVAVSNGINVGYSGVAAVEIAITLVCVILVFSTGFSSRDVVPLTLLWFIAVLAIIASISYNSLYIGSVRNFAIIAVFSMLGQRMEFRYVRIAFALVSAATLLVLIWEIANVESYAAFFSPARYYEATRGVATSEFDDSGLSVGTIAFEGRFSLGIFSGRRTSSIFLEQVSINSYAIICMIFLNGAWSRLAWKERVLQIVTIFLIVASNNARMGALMCIVMPVGYFLFPFISRYLIAAVPFLIISSIFAMSSRLENAVGDDVTGRLGVTYRLLTRFELPEYFVGNPLSVGHMFDSGYAFVLSSIGFFGGLAYLAFITLYPKFDTPEQKRGAWSSAVYILAWLTVGGTATFSIKTAALLWAFIGCLSVIPRETPVSAVPRRQR